MFKIKFTLFVRPLKLLPWVLQNSPDRIVCCYGHDIKDLHMFNGYTTQGSPKKRKERSKLFKNSLYG